MTNENAWAIINAMFDNDGIETCEDASVVLDNLANWVKAIVKVQNDGVEAFDTDMQDVLYTTSKLIENASTLLMIAENNYRR